MARRWWEFSVLISQKVELEIKTLIHLQCRVSINHDMHQMLLCVPVVSILANSSFFFCLRSTSYPISAFVWCNTALFAHMNFHCNTFSIIQVTGTWIMKSHWTKWCFCVTWFRLHCTVVLTCSTFCTGFAFRYDVDSTNTINGEKMMQQLGIAIARLGSGGPNPPSEEGWLLIVIWLAFISASDIN